MGLIRLVVPASRTQAPFDRGRWRSRPTDHRWARGRSVPSFARPCRARTPARRVGAVEPSLSGEVDTLIGPDKALPRCMRKSTTEYVSGSAHSSHDRRSDS